MIYIAFDGDFLKNSELFFPSSLHLIRILHFEGSSHIALLAFNVFLSPPLKIQIQTITRRAVILPASGMSENLLLISHVKKKKKLQKGRGRMGIAWLCLWLSGIHSNGLLGVMVSDWLGDDVIHITVWNSATKKHSGRQEGDLSLWLWLIQARGSTLGLQTRLCCHTRFIFAAVTHNVTTAVPGRSVG